MCYRQIKDVNRIRVQALYQEADANPELTEAHMASKPGFRRGRSGTSFRLPETCSILHEVAMIYNFSVGSDTKSSEQRLVEAYEVLPSSWV